MIRRTAVLLLGDGNDMQYASVPFLSAVAFIRRVSVVTLSLVLLVTKNPSIDACVACIDSNMDPLFTTQ